MEPAPVAEEFVRQPLLHEIEWLVKSPSLQIASAADFRLTNPVPVELERLADDYIIPAYCFDLNVERICFTCIPKARAADTYGAPFLYNAQRANSTTMLSIPFENLGRFLHDRQAKRPTFIFSPGRTGPTLLSRLLAAADQFSVSEPDLLTQLSVLDPKQRHLLGAAGQSALIRACLSSFVGGPKDDIFIKLRSHCTQIETVLVSAVANARAVFMFRNIADWATSRNSQFRENPKGLAQMLRRQIIAIDRLVSLNIQPIIVNYEDLLKHPLHELSRFVSITPEDEKQVIERLAVTLGADSQEGSALARGRRTSAVAAEFLADFQREWTLVEPQSLMAKHHIQIS